MQIVSSTVARNHLAAMLDAVRREPITIQRQGRNMAVLLSYDEYERLAKDSGMSREVAIQRFKDLSAQVAANARARGLTQEIFDEIMNQSDE